MIFMYDLNYGVRHLLMHLSTEYDEFKCLTKFWS